jgi:DNA-binding transcriptional MocR family regulator
LLGRALREGVAYLPGRYFAVARQEPGALRLSFAGLSPQAIGRGIEILGRVFSAQIERARSSEPAPAMV